MVSLRSMTGYGSASGQVAGRAAQVEVRSVNSRFLDVRVRLPWPELDLEARLHDLVRSRIERGRVEVRVAVPEGGGAATVRADASLAREIRRALEEVRSAVGLDDPVTLGLIAARAEVVSVTPTRDAEDVWSALGPLAREALGRLDGARAREGERLARDLRERLGRVRAIGEAIAREADGRPERYRREMNERLARLALPQPVDADRLAQEVALAAQRLDVTEERVRLGAHVEAIAACFEDATAAVGRRIDFFLQEVQRELGTIAAKSQSAPVSSLVVDARAEVEKMREQAQNLE